MAAREAIVADAARRFGTPCYVYLLPEMAERIQAVHEAFGGLVELSYAVKANPHHALLAYLRGRVPHLDVSSAGEVERALAAGWSGGDLSFTGPGKRRWELDYAIRSGVDLIVVESTRELALVNEIAAEVDTRQRILLRIGPARVPRGFGGSMSGRPSQFGIDEESLPRVVDDVRTCASVQLVGFHIYAGTQCLSPDTLVENFEMMIGSFRNARDLFGIEPRALVFGAGFGIPYYDDSVPLDLALLADRLCSLLTDARRLHFPGARLLLELGRFLVGEAGVFATSVIDVKPSRGRPMVICDGGMNHHLGAAGHLGTILPRNYRMFRVPGNPDMDVAPEVDDSTPCDIVGPLCTSIDTLGRKVVLGQVEPGDLIGIECSGAYGASVSPQNFISHPPPKEIFVESHGDGEWTVDELEDVRPEFPAYREVGA